MPDSKYVQRWDLVTMLALLFTAFVTPYEVALLESPELPGEAGAGGDEAASLAVVLRGAY